MRREGVGWYLELKDFPRPSVLRFDPLIYVFIGILKAKVLMRENDGYLLKQYNYLFEQKITIIYFNSHPAQDFIFISVSFDIENKHIGSC